MVHKRSVLARTGCICKHHLSAGRGASKHSRNLHAQLVTLPSCTEKCKTFNKRVAGCSGQHTCPSTGSASTSLPSALSTCKAEQSRVL